MQLQELSLEKKGGEDYEAYYVWQQTTGRRVILVIDDHYSAVYSAEPDLEQVFPAREPGSYGLYAIFRQATRWPDTRAIGYFWMPTDPDDMKQILLKNIAGWLAGVISEDSDRYFLIDIFDQKMNSAGLQVCEQLKGLYPNANFAFLSQAGTPHWDQVKKTPFYKANHFDIFSKDDFEKPEAEEGGPKPFGDKILSWFDAFENKGDVSSIDAQTWVQLRRIARQACQRIAQREGFGARGTWAHHLPHGGNRWAEKDMHAREDELTKELEKEFRTFMRMFGRFPAHGWLKPSQSIEKKSWALPPLRALAQFTNDGKDLTTAFCLVASDVQQLFNERASTVGHIHFGCNLLLRPVKLLHDYLWFNVSAVAEGLFTLANTFTDEVAKRLERTSQHPINWPQGCLGWIIEETKEADAFGLIISVDEYFLEWAEAPEHPWVRMTNYPFPLPQNADKSVSRAYQAIKNAGASIAVHDHGALVLRVPATVDAHGAWEVKV